MSQSFNEWLINRNKIKSLIKDIINELSDKTDQLSETIIKLYLKQIYKENVNILSYRGFIEDYLIELNAKKSFDSKKETSNLIQLKLTESSEDINL